MERLPNDQGAEGIKTIIAEERSKNHSSNTFRDKKKSMSEQNFLFVNLHFIYRKQLKCLITNVAPHTINYFPCKITMTHSLMMIPDLRVKNDNDYHPSGGYNNSPPPAPSITGTNYHEKPIETSVPPKQSPDIWPTKIITSKSGGIATADGKFITQ